jgi:hypothetical protein
LRNYLEKWRLGAQSAKIRPNSFILKERRDRSLRFIPKQDDERPFVIPDCSMKDKKTSTLALQAIIISNVNLGGSVFLGIKKGYRVKGSETTSNKN